jgi:hypothetical protein
VLFLYFQGFGENGVWRFLICLRRANAEKEFFIMRKLLLVMLAPILVLGVMGCGKIDPDVQTDYTIQGSWAGATDDPELAPYILVINAATMVVKYYTDVSTPYRTEYSPSNTDRADVKNAEGTLTLFDYQTNDEIASIDLALSAEGKILTIANTSWNIEEYYYSKAFPKEGKYTLQETDDGGALPPPPPPTPVVLTATDFIWDAGTIKWTGTTTPAPVFSVSYAGDTGTTYPASATPPAATAVGDYIATITVTNNAYFTAAGPLVVNFTIAPTPTKIKALEVTISSGNLSWAGLDLKGYTFTAYNIVGVIGKIVSYTADGAYPQLVLNTKGGYDMDSLNGEPGKANLGAAGSLFKAGGVITTQNATDIASDDSGNPDAVVGLRLQGSNVKTDPLVFIIYEIIIIRNPLGTPSTELELSVPLQALTVGATSGLPAGVTASGASYKVVEEALDDTELAAIQALKVLFTN